MGSGEGRQIDCDIKEEENRIGQIRRIWREDTLHFCEVQSRALGDIKQTFWITINIGLINHFQVPDFFFHLLFYDIFILFYFMTIYFF